MYGKRLQMTGKLGRIYGMNRITPEFNQRFGADTSEATGGILGQ